MANENILQQFFTIVEKVIQEYLYSVVISDSFWFPDTQATVAEATGYSSCSSSNR